MTEEQKQLSPADPKMTARDVKVFYGAKEAIKGVSIDVDMDNVTAFIGDRKSVV